MSGFSDTDSMPCCISQSAKSGWSLGPCPQMPMYLPFARAALMAMDNNFLTARFRSSNKCATMAESRSKPKVSCVKSFDPIEKPSKISRNSSASKAFDGSSHIMMIFRPFSLRRRPFFASTSITFSASSSVRTNGIITQALLKPMVSRTRLKASHSIAKHSAKLGST